MSIEHNGKVMVGDVWEGMRKYLIVDDKIMAHFEGGDSVFCLLTPTDTWILDDDNMELIHRKPEQENGDCVEVLKAFANYVSRRHCFGYGITAKRHDTIQDSEMIKRVNEIIRDR